MQGHSTMDIRGTRKSTNGSHVFMDIGLQLSMLLWISIDFFRYPCMDLRLILDQGNLVFVDFSKSRKICKFEMLNFLSLAFSALLPSREKRCTKRL